MEDIQLMKNYCLKENKKMDKESLFQEISEAVVEMEDELVEELCNRSLELSIPAEETITKGLVDGMDKVGQLYEDSNRYVKGK